MSKYIFLFVFIFVQPVFSTNPISYSEKSNHTFIFVLNIDECVPCLVNAYNTAKTLIINKVPKQNIIFVIEQKRKILEEKYVEKLKNILDYDKITLLWNSDLFNNLKEGNRALGKNSSLLIYDDNKKKFVFNMLTKFVSTDKISAYLN